MERLARMILDNLREGNAIPEDLLYELTTEAMKVVQTRQIEQLSPEFWELEQYVESFWRAQLFQTVQGMRSYEMGRLLSLTNMIAMVAEEEEKRQSLNEYALKFSDWYPVFKGMYDTPGITHKKLALTAGKSDSSLSQFMNKNQWEGLYIYRRFGREKNYYLTELGQRLYELMKDNQPRPTEEKYARFLGVKNNIEELEKGLADDSAYKVVRSDTGEFLESRIYGINDELESRKPELLAEILWNKNILEDKKEEKEICPKEGTMRRLKAL